MFDVRSDGFLTSDGRRFRCHASGVFLKVSDLKEPLPSNFGTLSNVERDNIVRTTMYRDFALKPYSKAESSNLVTCGKCGRLYHKSNGIHSEDYGDVCDYCKPNFRKCYHCGKWYYASYDNIRCWMISVDGGRERQYLCHNCFDDDNWMDGAGLYVMCDACSDLVLRDEVYNDDGDELCVRCHNRLKNQALRSYHYTDKPGYGMDFLGVEERSTKPLLGVELEIDEGGECNDNALDIKKAIGERMVVCTTDGSLHNGFEIVSCPANLYHHLNSLDWKSGMKLAKEMGYVSHDGGRCGLHVHIDRAFFGNELRDDVDAKFFIILRNNLSWIRTFSRRYNFGYCQINGYERSDDGMGDSLGAITYPPDKVWLKSKKQSGRHMALNFYPSDTVEVRVFRGTLNYKTFVATLQFCEMWANFVKRTDLNNITRISLAHFINAAERSRFTEFLDYLKDRKITDDNETGY